MRNLWNTAKAWADSWAFAVDLDDPEAYRVDWLRVMPFVAIHLACLGLIWHGWSPVAVGVAVALYWLRMLAITGFYHRYFSHRTFRTSRPMQLLFALAGATAGQRGPKQHGFFWSHVGWFTCKANFPTRLDVVPDLARFPELRLLDRFDALVPTLLAGSLFGLGEILERSAPGLGTSGPQMLLWGFFATACCWR